MIPEGLRKVLLSIRIRFCSAVLAVGLIAASPIAVQADKVRVDKSNTEVVFANAASVATDGRLVALDFGVTGIDGNSPRVGVATVRIVSNLFTAKRTHAALEISIQRHQQAFGQIKGRSPESLSVSQAVRYQPSYSNFVRVTGNPEELFLDFGVNTAAYGSKGPVVASHTIVLDYLVARDLAESLGELLSEHESRHGQIETEVTKRLVTPSN